MAMKTTGVAAKISADSSAFTKACNTAKAAAAQLKKDLKSITATPLPDIAKDPTFQYYKQRAAGEKALTAMVKAESDKRLKIEQDAMAAAQRHADIASRRRSVSGTRVGSGVGQWDHLAGTQFAGGSRGSSGSRGMGQSLGIAYNAV